MTDVWDDVMRLSEFMENREFRPVTQSQPLSERFRNIRHNYSLYQELVDADLASWMSGNPYEIANWTMLFTPIEAAAWHDIRAVGLPLWPQLPVGRYFVDFGNPVRKIALECDGKQWHDEKKDAKRDLDLMMQGWTVYRVPGWRCKRVIDRPDDLMEMSDEEQKAFWRRHRDETMRGVIDGLRREFTA